MQRGIISLTNVELKLLHDLAVSQDLQKEDLLNKISPVEDLAENDKNQANNVLISEDEAEVILDFMPIPTKDDNPDLANARIKIQQFLAKSRFPESSL